MNLLIDIKRIKHAKAKTLVGQAFFRWGGVSSPSNCKRYSCVLKKAFGETGAVNIVIVKAPSKTRKILLRVAVHALAFCNHSKGVYCKLQPARRLSGLKTQSSHGAKAGIALAMDSWHTSLFSGAIIWLTLYLSSSRWFFL